MQQEIKSNSNRESHTRGPWKLHAGTKTFHIAARDYYVAETKTDTIEDEANARLIAAAPELLYALERLVKELPSRRDWLDPDTEKLARHAVDKAQGKI